MATDGKCPLCGGSVDYRCTTNGYDDSDTGDREDPVVLYRCTQCGEQIPEDDLDWPSTAPLTMVPMVDVAEGDVVEYTTPVGPRMGTVVEVADDILWIGVDGDPENDVTVRREDVVRVVEWKEYLRTL